MNEDRLRFDLADLADEVTPVDLRDRALRTSRRLGIQRTVTTSVAALVMIAAATGTALAIRPDGQANLPAPATSVTSSSPPVEVTPTPESSATASASTSHSTPPAKPAVLGGTRYYLELTDNEARIHVVRSGRHEVNVLPLGKDDCVANSITISPDGKRLAWVQDANADGMNGTLVTSRIDGTRQRTVATGIICLGPRPLVWQGGDLLMANTGTRSLLMDMVAGKPHNGDPGQETDRCWSADGEWLASTDSDAGKHWVTGNGEVRQYTYTPPKDEAALHDGWQPRSVSVDGRYVAVGWVGTDPSRQDGSFAVVDVTTSKLVDLPGSGTVRSILFTLDGKVIVQREKTLTVLDADFQQVGTVTEPASVRGQWLLAYVP
ncbi:hypothetical protein ACGFI9_20350 [Micromonospora sp. NPDC048930]|uniref:hypothetical protein n=1 Tax=Micromonospora sp. NPDC048930 TaxID=3364261 RepID=UPI003716348D